MRLRQSAGENDVGVKNYVLGTRAVLEHLLSPVQRAFHEAARER